LAAGLASGFGAGAGFGAGLGASGFFTRSGSHSTTAIAGVQVPLRQHWPLAFFQYSPLEFFQFADPGACALAAPEKPAKANTNAVVIDNGLFKKLVIVFPLFLMADPVA